MATYEQLLEANRTIKTEPIKKGKEYKEYAQVNQRVKAFRMVFPNGGIKTDILSHVNGTIVMQAVATDEDGRIIATGTAYEKEGESPVNKTSYIENCETSAVGRCLGFAGFGIDTSICSAEELYNALEQQDAAEAAVKKRTAAEKAKAKKNAQKQPPKPAREAEDIARGIAEELGVTDIDAWLVSKGKPALTDMTDEELSSIVAWLGQKREKKAGPGDD